MTHKDSTTMHILHQRFATAAAALAIAGMLAACADSGPKQNVGTVLGGVGGAVAGAQFGSGKGRLVGVAAGTLLGALVGSVVGKSLDKADRTYLERSNQRALETAPSRSEEHTSELQSLMRISYAVFCLQK